MEEISIELFLYLTKKLQENVEIDNFVNSVDKKIYLIEEMNGENSFIVFGNVYLNNLNDIDYMRTDKLLYVRNKDTMKVLSIDKKRIKRVLEISTVEKYVETVKEVIEKYNELKHVTREEEAITNVKEEYLSHVKRAMEIRSNAIRNNGEGFLDYADRLSGKKIVKELEYMNSVLEIKKTIDRMVLKAFYMPESRKTKAELMIMRMISGINKELRRIIDS